VADDTTVEHTLFGGKLTKAQRRYGTQFGMIILIRFYPAGFPIF